jgi:hypothetical protein
MGDYAALNIEELLVAVHNALTSWGDLASTDDELLGFLLIVQQERAGLPGSPSPLDMRGATNRVLESALDELANQNNSEAVVLRSRFIEGETARQVASKMHLSPDQVNRMQRSAIENLSRILLSRELNARETKYRELDANLPPPTYSGLFGFEEATNKLSEKLGVSDQPWILSITGLGGIGKSSLADACVRRTLRSFAFDKVVWLQAASNSLSGAPLSPEESYSQLLNGLADHLWPGSPQDTESGILAKAREILTDQPHLIVIDNLETAETTTYLVEKVSGWTKPTKFLFTTRARPTGQTSVYNHALDELSLSDAADLLHHQAEVIGLDDLTSAAKKDIEAIYAVTGGNPLALKLVVSLAAVLPLAQVLKDVAQSRPGPIEELYRYIYWESWRSLGENAQSLLQAMPLVAEQGALPEQMRAISDLADEDFWPAVSVLISRSLLEIKGTIHERRYGIHRLTETFLRTEIIGWSE